MNDLSGTQLGHYQLIEPIGKGGMATVYRAYQPSMDRYVAIKIITPELATDPEFIARFQREVQIIAKLQHPNILPVYDSGRVRGLTYLVMRLMEGGSLANDLRSGPLPVQRVIHLTKQIAAALDYAHLRGIVHRDLKPTNILLDDAGNAYLTDFGIAKVIQTGMTSGHLTSPGAVMGTPTYMSPEQWRAEPVDGRTDVYALGVILYQMLLGQVPFAAETPHGLMYQHLDQAPPAPRSLNPNLPPGVDPVLAKALAKHRDNRYATATELARDLEYALRFPSRAAQRPETAPPPSGNMGLPPRPSSAPLDLDEEAAQEAMLRAAEEDDQPGLPPRPPSQPRTTPPYTVDPSRRTQERPPGPQPTAGPSSFAQPHYTQPAPPPAQPPVTGPLPPRNNAPTYQQPVYERTGYTQPPLTQSLTGSYRPYSAPPEPEPRSVLSTLLRLVLIPVGITLALAALAAVILGLALLSGNGSEEESLPTPPRATQSTTEVPQAFRPNVTILSPADNTNVSLGQSVTIQFAANGAGGVTQAELRFFDQVVQTVQGSGQTSFTGSFTYTPGSAGIHRLEVIAYSGSTAGNPAYVTLLVR